MSPHYLVDPDASQVVPEMGCYAAPGGPQGEIQGLPPDFERCPEDAVHREIPQLRRSQ